MTITFAQIEGTRDAAGKIVIAGFASSTIRQATVTVSNATATKIPTTPLTNRKFIIIINISDNVVYVGDSTIAAANGYPIYQRAAIQINVDAGVDVYGLAATAPSEVRILEGA